MRLRYSFDGSLGYIVNFGNNTKTSINQAGLNEIDGDFSSSQFLAIDHWLLFNFPDIVHIAHITLKVNQAISDLVFVVSADSTDGFDGTWTQIGTGNYATAYGTQDFIMSITNQDARWLKIKRATSSGIGWTYACHLFGEWQNPLYELWDSGGSAELTNDYPLIMQDAPNAVDYVGHIQFKIKNTDGVSHDYSLTVATVKYEGDSLVTSYLKLSTDGGSTKLTTVTISSLAAGTLSGVIDLYWDVTKANNPANGLHYFSINVTQTA